MLLTLDGRGPKYTQITRALIDAIRRGTIAPGCRAPSTRELANDLGCSRNLVLLAYEQLILEGYFVSHPRGGTFVAPDLPQRFAEAGAAHSPTAPRLPATLSAGGRRIVQTASRVSGPIRYKPTCAIDFICGLCEPDEGLLRQFKRALLRPLRNRAFSYGDPAGDPALRREIATRLRSARGITRSPDQIVLTSGTQQALDICARVLLGSGIRAVMEDPGYDVADAIFRAAGSTIVPGRVDQDGLDPACLPTDRSRVGLVYVTPSHQFPTGAVMPAARRYTLLHWARRARAFVFEDDYDGEFRYEGQPIPALAGLDPDAVIYCGTFAKSLFPSCRLGYLALPHTLVRPIVECKWLADRGSSRLVEGAIGELLATGHYDRHIRRMQRRYRARCAALERSLQKHLGSAVEVQGSSAGLHLVAWLPALPRRRVKDLIEACMARSIGVYPVDRYSTRAMRAGLLLGYGLVEIDDIDRGVRGLAEAYREVID